MDHTVLAKAEAHYYTDEVFRAKVEEVVTLMTIAISHEIDNQTLRRNRLLIRMTATVTLYMNEEKPDEVS